MRHVKANARSVFLSTLTIQVYLAEGSIDMSTLRIHSDQRFPSIDDTFPKLIRTSPPGDDIPPNPQATPRHPPPFPSRNLPHSTLILHREVVVETPRVDRGVLRDVLTDPLSRGKEPSVHFEALLLESCAESLG